MATSRMIREGFLDSEKVAALSWRTECFFHRLLLVADDYGLFDARPTVLRTRLFPLHLDKISNQDIQDCLHETEEAGLVRAYCVGGKDYVQIINFGQRRQSKPKFPLPDGDSPCNTVSHGSSRESTVNNGESRKSTAYTETETKTYTESEPCSVNRGVEQFPRSAEEVRLFMAAQLMTPKGDELKRCAESFFDDFSARGWRDSKGIPLANWQPAARKYARSWATNNVQHGRQQGPSGRKDANAGRRYE
jgi:hypothetical protein